LDKSYEEIGETMTTATYHPGTGFGQDVWNQSIQQYGPQPFGPQPFGPIGGQGFGMPSMQPQALPQQGWQQPFGLQTGQQILSVLPGLIAQQAQQLYAIAQVCSQLAPGSAYQFGLPQNQFGLSQPGQRPYPTGY
jgi:hypothetical protein